MKKIKRLLDAINLSVDGKTSGEINADFKIGVDGETWKCYTVAISYRDVLCYCDKGTATYVVDSYGDLNTHELFDWAKDELGGES